MNNLGKKCLECGKSEGGGKEMNLESRREQLTGLVVEGVR